MNGEASQAGVDFFDLAVLSVVQGITEFLPISSSGHLILASKFLDTNRGVFDGTVIDVALHLGSLVAVLVYFWRDVRDAVYGPFTLVRDVRAKQPLRWSSRLFLLLVVATIPLGIFGVILFATGQYETLRDEGSLFIIKLIGWTTLLYGAALYVADRFGPVERKLQDWTWKGALFLGVAQALALIPGTSRSGICMTASRVLGFDRREGSRVALLMAIPAILASAAGPIYKVYQSGNLELTADAAIGAGLSFLTAYATLFFLMRWLRNATFTPFVVYRLILGVVLLGLAYGGVLTEDAPAQAQTEEGAPAIEPAASDAPDASDADAAQPNG